MKYIHYIYALILVMGLSLSACDKVDDAAGDEDMLHIEGITLGLGLLDEAPAQASTRARVNGVDYAVNTDKDPTWTKDDQDRITGRNYWKLDLDMFNGNATDVYTAGSFTEATSTDGLNWKPSGDLLFPNYFRPWASAWLYHTAKDEEVVTDQSDRSVFLAQDQLFRPKGQLGIIAKKITLDLQHQRALLNFKFEDIVRADIDEATVKVRVGGVEYTPYNVRSTGTLEYMLILPEATSKGSEILVTYSTVATGTHQEIKYVQKVTLDSTTGTLGSNNAYCFTLSGKEMAISPVTIVNWVTGEPVSGQYVAVTAYPTFKGPASTTYYFYYDNKLTVDGKLGSDPKLQIINFNRDGECTIKPDGRILTHIFTDENAIPTDANALSNPVILGNTEKMYIDLTTVIANL